MCAEDTSPRGAVLLSAQGIHSDPSKCAMLTPSYPPRDPPNALVGGCNLPICSYKIPQRDGGGEVLSVSYFPGDSPAHKTPKPNQNLRSETLEGKLKFVKQLAAPTSYGDNKDS
eukprot:8590922-Pyramimonas_sp.AAC.2